jgi:hypothetical protein
MTSIVMRGALVLVFCGILMSSPCRAADTAPPAQDAAFSVPRDAPESRNAAPVEFNGAYITGYWTDTKNMASSPMRWDAHDWLEASLVVGTGIALFVVDENIQTWVQDHKNRTTSHISDAVKKTGTLSAPALAALGIYGYAAKDARAKKTFLLSIESFLITGAYVQTLKHVTGRHRPNTGDSHNTWSGPSLSGSNDVHSFPSGDASSAFAVAAVVASEYDNRIVPPLVYTASALIALSRVHNNAHWSSDIFIGSAIGYYTGKAIVASHREGSLSRVSLAPFIEGNERGVMITYRF